MGFVFAFFLIAAIPAIAYFDLVRTPGIEPPFRKWTTPQSAYRPVSPAAPAVADASFSSELDKALEAYIGQQPEPKPSRTETVRRIVEDRLVHEGFYTRVT